jgi:hypothetical protein
VAQGLYILAQMCLVELAEVLVHIGQVEQSLSYFLDISTSQVHLKVHSGNHQKYFAKLFWQGNS